MWCCLWTSPYRTDFVSWNIKIDILFTFTILRLRRYLKHSSWMEMSRLFYSQYNDCCWWNDTRSHSINRHCIHLVCPEYSCLLDDVIKWKHFPRYWPFVRGIYRSPVNSPHKGQWRGDLMLSVTPAWINGLVNNREAGDLRRHRVHYDVILMIIRILHSEQPNPITCGQVSAIHLHFRPPIDEISWSDLT